MNDNEFMDWFSGVFGGNNSPNKSWSDEDELNSLWESYNSFVQELKADGYKVMRNEFGKHKLIKN